MDLLRFLPLALCLAIVFQNAPLARSTSEFDEGNRLHNVGAEYWTWRMVDDPEFATTIGHYAGNDKLRSYEYDEFEKRKNRCEDFLKKLNDINVSKLNISSKITYDLLKDSLETYVDGFKWRHYGSLNPINHLEGIHARVTQVLRAMPMTTKSDYIDYLERLRSVATQVQQQITLMKMAIDLRTTNHNVSMIAVPHQINAMYNQSIENIRLYLPFKNVLDRLPNSTLNQTEKDSFRNEAKMILENMVKPAFLNLARFIANEYIPTCRTSYGVGELPNGVEYYKACLKWHLSSEITPEAVHLKGLTEIERLKKEIMRIAQKTGFNGTNITEFFATLRNDSRFYVKSGGQLLQIYNDTVHKLIKPQIGKFFLNPPDYPLAVVPMSGNGPLAAYTVPSEDGSSPGIFWVNLHKPTEKPTFYIPALSLHEALPGHHLQSSYRLREKAPIFRKQIDFSRYYSAPFHFPFFTAFIEGWGLYSEDLGEEMDNVYANDYELFGKYSFEIFRASRLVVDTGIHVMKWSRDRAIDFLAENTFESKSALAAEIDRYITWPGQACAYKIGQLKMRDLRKRAEMELGTSFNLAEFHDRILRLGTVPLRIVEDEVDRLIQEKLIKITTAAPVSRGHTFNPTNSCGWVMLVLFVIIT